MTNRIKGLNEFVTEDPATLALIANVKIVAASDVSVLIIGESGTGKELLAKLIHSKSPRGAKRWVPVNCAAIADSLAESELFGHRKGAFTGASASKKGLFEIAHGSSIFLDEIGDMPSNMQAELLRVLQESRVRRVGEIRERKIDFRVISATNMDLSQYRTNFLQVGRVVPRREFRPDLFYRLSGLVVSIPPLRERPKDLLLLTRCFLERDPKRRRTINKEALISLQRHSWPGNVRELFSVLELAEVLAGDGEIEPAHLQINDAKGIDLGSSTGIHVGDTITDAKDKLVIATRRAHPDMPIQELVKILGIGERSFYRSYSSDGLPKKRCSAANAG